jgi:hypothetical protein
LKPLAELQYRGVIWSQANARDWTLRAFLLNLNLEVPGDAATREALRNSLLALLDEETEPLAGKRLDRDYFINLSLGGDPIRELLRWLDQAEIFKAGLDPARWKAFAETCKMRWGFDPDRDGVLAAAERFAKRQDRWSEVWERFAEAPGRYPHIPEAIRRCRFLPNLFSGGDALGWPQWNEAQENELRGELSRLAGLAPEAARETLLDLEKRHHIRRQSPWAELGEAGLALALEPLAALAEGSRQAPAADSLAEMAEAHQSSGWRVDDSVLRALALTRDGRTREAVAAAVRAVYLPWLVESALRLQELVGREGYAAAAAPGPFAAGVCLLFVDGLRLDAGPGCFPKPAWPWRKPPPGPRFQASPPPANRRRRQWRDG